MIACRRLRFPLVIDNFVSARTCLVNLFQRVHIDTSEKLDENRIPEKPKKPMNGYLRFSQSVLAEYKQNNPDKTYKEILKLVATAWSSLDIQKKNEYVKQFNDDHEIYKKKLEEYKDLICKYTFKDDTTDHSTLKLKSKMLQKPKKPPNAFLLYKSSRRAEAESKNLSFQEWAKEVSADWHDLDHKEKDVFVDMAAKMTEEYKLELDAWQRKMVEEGHTDVLNVPRRAKGSTAHNVTLQAGQETKNDRLPDTKLNVEQSNIIEKSRNKSHSHKKDVTESCQPILNIADLDNISQPKVNIEEDPHSNTAMSGTAEIKKECLSMHNEVNTESLMSTDIKAKCNQKTQNKVNYFERIQEIQNIRTEYLLGGTCSFISISLCLWYLLQS